PAIDDVPDQIKRAAVVVRQEIGERFSLASARAQMGVGNEDRSMLAYAVCGCLGHPARTPGWKGKGKRCVATQRGRTSGEVSCPGICSHVGLRIGGRPMAPRCPSFATVLLQCGNRFVNPARKCLKSLIYAALHKIWAAE